MLKRHNDTHNKAITHTQYLTSNQAQLGEETGLWLNLMLSASLDVKYHVH